MKRWGLLIGALAVTAGGACAEPLESLRPGLRTSGAQVYQIPAMPLKDALAELAAQSGVSIDFNGRKVGRYRSRVVVGVDGAANALKIMLSRTPFDFEITGPDTVRLVARTDARPPKKRVENGLAPSMRPDAIVVTATKRTAYAHEIPVSISAVDQATLRRYGVRDFNALAPKLAGVSFTNLGSSRNKIFVRGISDGAFADRTQSTVGVYLDETPVIFNDTNPDIRLVDIQRIEIVRGPQGALYGTGSIGGVYRIITNKPDVQTYSGRIRVSGSATQDGGVNETIDGVVNLPVIPDRLGVRVTGYYDNADGYIDDIGLNLDNVNQSEISGGRVGARLKLSQAWTLDASANMQTVRLADTQYVFPGLGDLKRATARREPYRDELKLFNTTLRGDIGGAEVTSSTAYIRRETSDTNDATAALPSITGDAGAEGVFVTDDRIRTFNHETRIVSDDAGAFAWLAGGFFSRRKENLSSRLIVDNVSPKSLPFTTRREDEVREIALFGQASYEFIRDAKLTFGMRWSRTSFGIDVNSGGAANSNPSTLEESRVKNSFTPKIALSYKYSDSVLFYAQAARGARIGGFNVNTPLAAITAIDPDEDITRFESDALWNTEVGMKSSWLDGNLTANVSAFFVTWSDIQSDQILPNGFSFIANAGNAQNHGFEAELTARPHSNLEFYAAFFWNDPELKEANSFLNAHPGDALPNIAAVSASFGAVYDFPLPGRWEGALSADYSYVGRSFLTFAEETAPRMGDYHVGNLRLTAHTDQLRVGVYAENIWNERGDTFSFGNPFSLSAQRQATPVRPRTIGVFVEASF